MSAQEAQDAIADALRALADEIEGLQVYSGLNPNPTPPSLDVYGGNPFLTGAGFGVGNVQVFFTIRARVSTADHEAGNRLLLQLMDPTSPGSVQAAVENADVAAVMPDGVSGPVEYVESTAEDGRLLGTEWRVSTFL